MSPGSKPPDEPLFVGEKFKSMPGWRIPAKMRGLLFAVIVLGVIATAAFTMCFKYVQPYQYGIKEVKVGVNRGVQQKLYTAGYAFVIPFGMERIHLFPRNVMALELTAFPEEKEKGDTSRHYVKAAKIQTSDGFYVDVDVTILYKIIDPYKLITTVGPGELFLHGGILPKAEPILKQAFGELTTEDFYNSPLRTEKSHKARDLLDAELEPKGIQVDHVLVRYFKYSEEIQRNIEEKKLQDQLVFRNQAEAKAAIEGATLSRVSQEGEMIVKVALEEGNAYKVKREAEKELYTRQRKAEGDLQVKLAEAKRAELKRGGLQGVGADRMVAMKMAEVLQGLETIVVPSGGESGFNPLDLSQVLQLFGAGNDAAEGAAPAAAPTTTFEPLTSPEPIPPTPLPALTIPAPAAVPDAAPEVTLETTPQAAPETTPEAAPAPEKENVQ